MRIGLILGVVGRMLRLFSLAFIPPLLMAIRDGLFEEDWSYRADFHSLAPVAYFLCALVLTRAAGTLMQNLPGKAPSFYRTEALAVAAGSWVGIGLFGAIPYLFFGLSPTRALFESVSGFTTTGATILTGEEFEAFPRSFFLWRAMTQWFGGLGVIALFVVVLPRLGIAGRQIFFAEASGAPGEAVSPQVRRSSRNLWLFYGGLTALMATLLVVLDGWSLYHGIVHALTTMSAGGFSPFGDSISGQSATAQWIFTPFMFIAGASYPLLYIACTRKPGAILRDGEFRLYFAVSLLAAIGLWYVEVPWRDACFQVTSLISSAGFASADYNLWADDAKVILLIVMILGGCAGSAAGGAKEVRFLLVGKFLLREFTRVLHPRAVLPIRHGGRAVPDDVMRTVFTLVFLYIVGYFIVAFPAVLAVGDLKEGFSAAVACLSNVGPAFGDAGPMGNFDHYSPPMKLWFTSAMLIGRLEIVTILALFHPHVFRNISWRGTQLTRPKLRP